MGMRIIGSASSRAGFAEDALGARWAGVEAEIRGATVASTRATPSSAGFVRGALGIGSIDAGAEILGAKVATTGTASSSAGFAGPGIGWTGAGSEPCVATGSATGAEGSGGAFGTGWLEVAGGDVRGRDGLAHAGGETGV